MRFPMSDDMKILMTDEEFITEGASDAIALNESTSDDPTLNIPHRLPILPEIGRAHV